MLDLETPLHDFLIADDEPDWLRFRQHAVRFGIQLSDFQLGQFQQYLAALRAWNQRFNLTAIHDPQEILLKHFLDSIACTQAVEFTRCANVIDVGTGAGFPGLVLKIVFPHLKVTLLDAVQKRLNFLNHLIERLEMSDVSTFHERAEIAASSDITKPEGSGSIELRERFDVVTARAVAPMRTLLEWTLPFARVGGGVIAMKGPNLQQEMTEAATALRLLGAGCPNILEYELDDTGIGRTLVYVPKRNICSSKYPRRPGTARKAPL